MSILLFLTAQGTTWGVGGTCVNVGCIPKQLSGTTFISELAAGPEPHAAVPMAVVQPNPT